MSKRQTRRTISMTASVYVRLRQLARGSAESMSGMVEELVERECDAKGVPLVSHEDAVTQLNHKQPYNPAESRKRRARSARSKQRHGGTFSF